MRVTIALAVVLVVALAGCGQAVTTTTPAPETSPTTPDSPTPARTDASFAETWEVTVVEVVDGDTFEVRFPDGHTEDVRLLGVDTPEVHVANDPAEFEGVPETGAGERWLRDWGHKASEFAHTQLGGEQITIATDRQADRRGSYGRLLVYAMQEDGTNFNRQLIAQGYARLYDSPFSKRDAFADLEARAQRERIGLWNHGGATTGTTDDSGLAVARVHADAAGNDNHNLNDEYIVLTNDGDQPIDLTGWTVSDAVGHTLTFPGITLQPGATLTIYTGSGTDSETAVYWNAVGAIWNNGGDTITVRTASDATVLVSRY